MRDLSLILIMAFLLVGFESIRKESKLPSQKMGNSTFEDNTTNQIFSPNSQDFTYNYLSQYNPGGITHSLVIRENIAYVCTGEALCILNVSDPTHPSEIGKYENGYNVNRVQIVDDIAYIANGYRGLTLINISDPTNPIEIGNCDEIDRAWDLDVYGDYVFVASLHEGLSIVNVQDSTNPSLIGQYYDGGEAFEVRVANNIAYIADWLDGLEILNVSDPTNPVEMAELRNGEFINSIGIKENYAYICSGDTFRTIDISDPSHPLEVDQYTQANNFNGFRIWGDFVYSCKYFKIIDISTPANLKIVPTSYFSMGLNAIGDIVIQDNLMYIGTDSGVFIANFSTTTTSPSTTTTTSPSTTTSISQSSYQSTNTNSNDSDFLPNTTINTFLLIGVIGIGLFIIIKYHPEKKIYRYFKGNSIPLVIDSIEIEKISSDLDIIESRLMNMETVDVNFLKFIDSEIAALQAENSLKSEKMRQLNYCYIFNNLQNLQKQYQRISISELIAGREISSLQILEFLKKIAKMEIIGMNFNENTGMIDFTDITDEIDELLINFTKWEKTQSHKI